MRHDRPRTHDGVVPNRHPLQHDDVRTQPNVVADDHRLRFHSLFLVRDIGAVVAVIEIEHLHVRSEKSVASDIDTVMCDDLATVIEERAPSKTHAPLWTEPAEKRLPKTDRPSPDVESRAVTASKKRHLHQPVQLAYEPFRELHHAPPLFLNTQTSMHLEHPIHAAASTTG